MKGTASSYPKPVVPNPGKLFVKGVIYKIKGVASLKIVSLLFIFKFEQSFL
jgi:hypothetical protein